MLSHKNSDRQNAPRQAELQPSRQSMKTSRLGNLALRICLMSADAARRAFVATETASSTAVIAAWIQPSSVPEPCCEPFMISPSVSKGGRDGILPPASLGVAMGKGPTAPLAPALSPFDMHPVLSPQSRSSSTETADSGTKDHRLVVNVRPRATISRRRATKTELSRMWQNSRRFGAVRLAAYTVAAVWGCGLWG
jgi:hypothetical protein